MAHAFYFLWLVGIFSLLIYLTYKYGKLKRLKILIIDDDETAGLFLSIILEHLTDEVLFAKDGLEGVNICKSNPDIDLIFMDICMPNMNGIDTTKKIRNFNKTVKIIAESSIIDNKLVDDMIKAGCDGYISKPINNNILYKLINKLIYKIKL